MSRDWTKDELQAASKAMKKAGHLGYEEFCEQLNKTIFTGFCKDAESGSKPIAFGDFSYYWVIGRSPIGIRTLTENFLLDFRLLGLVPVCESYIVLIGYQSGSAIFIKQKTTKRIQLHIIYKPYNRPHQNPMEKYANDNTTSL